MVYDQVVSHGKIKGWKYSRQADRRTVKVNEVELTNYRIEKQSHHSLW